LHIRITRRASADETETEEVPRDGVAALTRVVEAGSFLVVAEQRWMHCAFPCNLRFLMDSLSFQHAAMVGLNTT
jgi:hypothetical protein